ncbi:MAG: arginine--tRNA ligase [Bacteroidetes bacterium]|nr:arginine--tRNA ligase [Bacteroidota bacterium]MDA1122596.1 arginine--tRNA ligase [Bacteroidota bacterium]
MSIEQRLQEEVSQAFNQLFDFKLKPEEVAIQPTRKEFEGSHTFVTFQYLKITKKSPEQSGQAIGEYLRQHSDIVQDFNVVKGFLNLVIADNVWLSSLNDLRKNENYGQLPANGQKVMVEYSSPNTNKPLHLGHLRNNFIGYSVSEILKANGYEVMKVQIVNDRGIHICKSMVAYEKFGDGETPESSNTKGDHLIGKYYVKFDQEYKKEIQALVAAGKDSETAEKTAPILLEAQDTLQKWERRDQKTVDLWKKMNGWVYKGFDDTYHKMGVDFDKYYYESDTYLLGKDIVDQGLSSKVLYRNDDGSVWIDLEEDGLDKKLLLRSDGTSVYMTQDLGTADMRHQDYPFDKCIYVVGNEQDYHFKVLFLILKKLGKDFADGLHHLSYGMVDLPSGKMKSREGTVVDADELIADMLETATAKTKELGKIEGFTTKQATALYEVLGLGALKYFLLKVDPKKRMLFNPSESIEFQGNTGPFIQYTHARIAAILRRAKELNVVEDFNAESISLQSPERELIRLLSEYPLKVREAGENYSPSVIAQYVYDLAKEYNRFYAELSIFGEEDQNIVSFRVALSGAVTQVIKKGMTLLGIIVPERM